MIKVKIYGAGSIGNHLAQACRSLGWGVAVIDRDSAALERMKADIYPKRYGAWDEEIRLYRSGQEPVGGYDVIFIGTPPDTHLSLATKILQTEAPRLLQIEKPLCSPTLAGLDEFLTAAGGHKGTAIIVGFNHILAANTLTTEQLIRDHRSNLGQLIFLEAGVRSHWENIFKAHPWLSGPQDTYLGFWQRGGGAGGEHIHALNLWQHFAHFTGRERVAEVQGMFEYIKNRGAEYDRLCFLQLVTEVGLCGRVIQDVITRPKKKWAELQFEGGTIEWWNDVSKTTDEVHLMISGKEREVIKLEKTRTEEFRREVDHINAILNDSIKIQDSPIRLERGMDSMLVLAAGHQSQQERRTVVIDYSRTALSV